MEFKRIDDVKRACIRLGDLATRGEIDLDGEEMKAVSQIQAKADSDKGRDEIVDLVREMDGVLKKYPKLREELDRKPAAPRRGR